MFHGSNFIYGNWSLSAVGNTDTSHIHTQLPVTDPIAVNFLLSTLTLCIQEYFVVKTNWILGWVYLYRSKINKWNKNSGRDVGSTESITTAPGRKKSVNSRARGCCGGKGAGKKKRGGAINEFRPAGLEGDCSETERGWMWHQARVHEKSSGKASTSSSREKYKVLPCAS
jgi:hypothetical protein